MDNNRPLAVVGVITKIEPIEGADLIQRADVYCGASGRWSGVVGKDISEGDKVTVFMQDAVLPPNERWGFMERHKWRVRMARFKGVPSECVIVRGAPDMEPGIDMTSALGVKKYEKPVPAAMAGEAIGAFPSFIPKTDEPNFQAVPEMVEEMDGDYWVARLKMDGTSCTVWRDDDGELHVASRNWEIREFTSTGASNVYWRCARKYDWSKLPAECALQFEVCGPGVQKNPAGLDELTGFAFTIYDYGAGIYRDDDDMVDAANAVGMPVAQLIEAGNERLSTDELRELANQRYPMNGAAAEGVVVRSYIGEWSFKSINLAYKD